MTRVLVTGVTGQDGWEMARQLLDLEYDVWGLVRWESSAKATKLQAELPKLKIVYGDLIDQVSLATALEVSDPDIVYNLAALASSGQSWAQPMMMGEINALGVLKLLEAIRAYNPEIRMVQASTSEQYGRINELPQSERTPFGSLNVYGVAKTFAHQACINYRDSYSMHISTALMHNHVSTRRHDYFVDRKITKAAARIKYGLQTELRLGNTDARRDWGWGPEYMQAWQLIAAHHEPGDYVIATGVSHSVQEFVELAFESLDLDWSGFVVRDEAFMRPTDTVELRGDPSYIEKTLGWKAHVDFEWAVEAMTFHDKKIAYQEAHRP